ncbi:MAG TPA: hypothetical protein VMS65_00150 [Polyangiaceae bacterium]|nr:hypothetical protein [Polyangiaceae bacterium]
MTLPKRFLDEQSDADDFERAVLRAESDGGPPVGTEREVFARVMAVALPLASAASGPAAPVEPVAGGALGTGALVKGATTLGSLGKGFALGIGVSIAAATGSHLFGESTPQSGSSVPHAASVATLPRVDSRSALGRAPTSPVASGETPPPEGEARAAVMVAPQQGAVVRAEPPAIALPSSVERTPGAPSVASFESADERAVAASRLKEEAALLRRARSELRAGALAAAFATLEASRQKFTAPELSQEREALAIELLYRSGERAAAAVRAREFLLRFPESPHGAAIRAFSDSER